MRITFFALLICFAGFCPAAVVAFTPDLDADIEPNISALNKYDSDTNQTDAPAGILDNLVPSFTGTYYFEDFGSGIEFRFDMTWTAVGGNLNGNTTTLGVGDNAIGGAESMTVAVSNLTVDFTNYISGSVDAIAAPTLDSATISFDMIRFADRSSTVADESIIDIVGSSATTWGTAAGGVGDNLFVLGSDGLTNSETSLLLSQNSGSTGDTDFSLDSTRMKVNIAFSESAAAAVPEPSGIICLVLLCGTLAGRRRR